MSTARYIRRALMILGVGALIAAAPLGSGAPFVSGPKRLVVLRVYFNDYTATSRYTQAQVQAFFTKLNTLWGSESSYGDISLSEQVSTLFKLPSNRSTYIDTPPDVGGDLSSGGKYGQVLSDAVANSPAGLNWNNIDGVMVLMAETDTTKFHRGQGNKCNLPMGPGSSNTPLVGCAIFSENPGQTDVEVWGRWAHEIGHAFQGGGPAHPSDYNSSFEQMDRDYPGQTGVFEKQSSIAFGWMPNSKYFIVTPSVGGAMAGVYAEEYNPGSKPNAQAIKAYISGIGSAYYLISVRRRVLGDNLNDSFSPPGIPDEGVLIERVTENTDPWVTVQGNPDRDKLWHETQTYTNAGDGINITVLKKFDPDDYLVSVRYGDSAHRPDVGLNSWLEPPGNTYETTDIWVDSPVNGYGTFRYGKWSDLFGGIVPQGNGDDPAVGQINRVFARIRNYGSVSATNVVVHFDVTNPLGLGINGANGFVPLGTVNSTQFPGLASIAPGGSTDVYTTWTPNVTLTAQQLKQGIFYFHTCLRVRIDHVPGETIFGNQDGNGQQENIDYFQVPPTGGGGGGAPYQTVIHLHNDDPLHAKFFNLSYDRAQVPPGWKVMVNGGTFGVQLAPNEDRTIPVDIVPSVPIPLGNSAGVVISASSLRLLTSDKDPKDKHPDFHTLGGVRVEGHAVARTTLACTATAVIGAGNLFKGKLSVASPGKLDPTVPIFLEAVSPTGKFLNQESGLAQLAADGTFSGDVVGKFSKAICMFAGTSTLASSTSGIISVH